LGDSSTVRQASARRQLTLHGRVAVVTDTVAQIDPQTASEMGITVVPMKLALGDREYRDGIDISPAELYRRMREDKVLPRTSSPSVGEYEGAFRSLLAGGAAGVVCLTLSSRLTMAFAAASLAAATMRAEFPSQPVEVVDTRTAARAEGFVALKAAQAAAHGASMEEVVAAAQSARERVGLVATVDTLEYLVRGGRVNLAVGLLGDLLQVKPLLTIQSDGTATCIARRRTRRAALEYMVQYVAERLNNHTRLEVAVMHADAAEEALELQKRAVEVWPEAEVAITDFTAVMGGHTGPGLIGLAYYYE